TMTIRELVSAAKMGTDIDRTRMLTMQLSDRNGLYGTLAEPGGFLYSPPRDLFEGASVLLPVSIPEYPVTWKQIQALTELLFRSRALYLSHTQVSVLNAGAKSGLARTLATELARYGVELSTVENAGITKQKESFVVPRTDAEKHVATFLSTLLSIPVGTLPADLPPEKAAAITIIVGSDYSYEPLQVLLPDRP
ncbi:MAG TPA: LytR C-terminal domain-containing protein, partial [Candidatus Peribacteraceae bacterium]|nr:LytR C-terminal domain-containing protein [Candidatus Peribacteraceae bacterium]